LVCSDCDRRVRKLNRLWPWIVLLALFVGIFVSGKYYQVQCNDFIIENFLRPDPCYSVSDDGNEIVFNHGITGCGNDLGLPFNFSSEP